MFKRTDARGLAGMFKRRGGEEETDPEEAEPAMQLGANLPSTDVELTDWIEAAMKGTTDVVPINYNFAHEYYSDLGFFVAVDGALRLERQLPSASLITFAPPGSFYGDTPVVDCMKATLDYDMTSYLSDPRWTDGFQHFTDVVYDKGLAIIIDIRTSQTWFTTRALPSSSTSGGF
eukprot:gene32639-17654_t